METFQLLSLDVWGNEEEGFEVNAAYYTGKSFELTLEQWENDEYLINLLIKEGYLVEKARELVEVDCDGGSVLTFQDKETWEPLYQLQMQ